jgi:hypothetical protein
VGGFSAAGVSGSFTTGSGGGSTWIGLEGDGSAAITGGVGSGGATSTSAGIGLANGSGTGGLGVKGNARLLGLTVGLGSRWSIRSLELPAGAGSTAIASFGSAASWLPAVSCPLSSVAWFLTPVP